MQGKTWLLSAISGSIAVGSCVLNDFFDYAVDVINDPGKVPACHAQPCCFEALMKDSPTCCPASHALLSLLGMNAA